MKKELTASEMGRKGGTAKWAKIPKKDRSAIMSAVRKAKLLAKDNK